METGKTSSPSFEASSAVLEKRPPFGLLLCLSFLIFASSHVIDQFLRWTDPAGGLLNGFICVGLFSINWIIFILPLNLACRGRYRRAPRPRRWLIAVLTPATLYFLLVMSGLITSPPDGRSSFARFAKTHLPSDAGNFHSYLWGGGIADYNNHYYFETSPAETDLIISAMNLKPDRSFDATDGGHRAHIRREPKGLPEHIDFRAIPGTTRYFRNDIPANRYYELFTDATRTRVHVRVSSI